MSRSTSLLSAFFLVLLLHTSLVRSGSVSEQFHLAPAKNGHASECWYACHLAITTSVPNDWGLVSSTSSATGTTVPVATATATGSAAAATASEVVIHAAQLYLTTACSYDVYLETMAECFPVYCASSWDVEYAVEYGTVVCDKAGVKNVTFPVAASYTLTAGGYFATGVLAASSSAAPRAVWPLAAGFGAVLGAVVVGGMAVMF